MNYGWSLIEGKESTRFPLWCYLYYDHLVTWDRQLADFFLSHPRSFKQAHVVGCLWAGHVTDRREARCRARRSGPKDLGDRFMVAVFDTTYSLNGTGSYDEAMAFAADILRLAEEVPDLAVILKEKKARGIHEALDPVRGPKLVEFYRRMDRHPRITVCTDEQDAEELVSAADVVVSFPFTSTTFEALAAGRPALWHDPLGLYRHAAYAKVPGVTTRGYEELKARILEIQATGSGRFENPIPAESPLMDPWRDDQAIERFRQLLASADPGRPAGAAGAGASTH
jgi:polysaccharide biosynthesis PFTS motif protein